MPTVKILKYFDTYEGSWKEISDIREVFSIDFQFFVDDRAIEVGELLYKLLEENKNLRKQLDNVK